MDSEEWRAVVGYEGRYEVSNLGRVRSLDRLVRGGKGGLRPVKGRVLKPMAGQYGHLSVDLCKGGRRIRRMSRVHRLVLESFVGPCPDGMEVCHYDGDPANNRIENLRYDTRSANMFDRVRHGRDLNSVKTHCKHGHPFDEQNTYPRPEGGRSCRTCMKARMGKWVAKQGKRSA